MKTRLASTIVNTPLRLPMLIGVYPGLEMIGASVREAVTHPGAQAEAVLALHARYHSPLMLTAMDLSAEAEAFGSQIRIEANEIPTVIGRHATTQAEIDALPIPSPGEARTSVHLAAARQLAVTEKAPVLGGMIGPFSLAGRIFGVSEALEATLSSPELLIALLEKATAFLCQYAVAFREAGACGVIMAEPAAGLLSPRGLARFSAPYVKQVVEAAQNKDFTLVLHNCSAKLAHLPRILESGAEIYHFGAPMDLPSALAQVDGKVILCGNLDPTAVFKSGSSDEVREKTKALLESTAAYPNYVISSGCDLAPQTPLENLDTFYQTVNPIYYCS